MDPSDRHWDLVDERSYRVAAAAIEALARHEVDYVVGGGWAVFAYDPSTPSVDFDVYVRGRLDVAVVDELTSAGFRVGAQQEVEPLRLDERVELLGTGDPDLGVPSAGYVPEMLFDGRIVLRELRFEDETYEVPVPSRPALAIVKLAALRGRSIGYAMFEDAAVAALLDPSTATMMKAQSQGYYLRKAGKDLFDVSLLLRDGAEVDACRTLAERFSLWDALVERLPDTPTAVRETAQGLARRVEAPDPLRVLAMA